MVSTTVAAGPSDELMSDFEPDGDETTNPMTDFAHGLEEDACARR